jgi:hypothetical protein
MMENEIKIGVKAAEDVTCSNCQKLLPGSEVHSFRGKDNQDVFFCSECKKLIDEEFQKEVENPNYIGAIILGILAGIVSGFLWYMIEVGTNRIIGYVALGAGYLIGWAVVFGSGKKRGPTLQFISATITLISILGASYFSALHFINKYIFDEFAKQGETYTKFLWISPFDSDLMQMIISPMGLLIWGIGIYIAFRTPKAKKL